MRGEVDAYEEEQEILACLKGYEVDRIAGTIAAYRGLRMRVIVRRTGLSGRRVRLAIRRLAYRGTITNSVAGSKRNATWRLVEGEPDA